MNEMNELTRAFREELTRRAKSVAECWIAEVERRIAEAKRAEEKIVPQPAFCYFTEILDAKTETRRRAVENEAVALGYGEQLKKYRNAECPLRYKCRCGDSQHAEIGKLPDYLIKQFREATQESE